MNALYVEDSQKHIWIAYKNTTMISRIDSLGNYRKHYQLKMQKHDNSQRQISQDHDGRLWVFSKNEALNYYDKMQMNSSSFPSAGPIVNQPLLK
ncbi:MAG: hypothetical protein ACLUE2_13535 [Bacteroides cellulosilyticus]